MPTHKAPVKRSASLASVAKKAGFSTATVSLVLGGRHRDYGVSDDTAERIREVADEQGYQRPVRRRGPPRLHIVHFEDVLRMDERGMGSCILQPLIESVTDRGWLVSIDTRFPTEPTADLLSASAVLVPVNHGYDGAAAALVSAAAKAGVQPIVLGRHLPNVTALQIDGDQTGGGRLVAEFLLGQGHRSIALVGGIIGDPHSDARLQGFKAFAENTAQVMLWGPGNYTVADARRVVAQGLQQSLRPTALFCVNDRMALGALLAIREAGLSVPHDISLVGFDDQQEFVQVDPRLTTVRFMADNIGDQIAGLLEQSARLRNDKLTMTARLIVRSSTTTLRTSP